MQVSLSSIRAQDARTLFRWINDPETVRHNAAYRPVHWAHHVAWLKSLKAASDKTVFAILVRDRLKGVVQLIDIDPVHRSAELVIRIGAERDRGKGIGTAALRLALDFAWRDLNLQRVWLRVFSGNRRAIRAYRKSGFAMEGLMRRAAHIDGKYVDVAVLGALRAGAVARAKRRARRKSAAARAPG